MDRVNLWAICSNCGQVVEAVLGTPRKPDGRADLHGLRDFQEGHERRSPACRGAGIRGASAGFAVPEGYTRVRGLIRAAEKTRRHAYHVERSMEA